MFACLDVDYQEPRALAACVLFQRFNDPRPSAEWVEPIAQVEAYEPGAFYKRELPCLLQVLARAPALSGVVIDGYVWLSVDGASRPGLGAKLFEALGERVPVIGVAKTYFVGADGAAAVVRGESQRPLYVTAAGLPREEAAAHIKAMHGAHRIPSLLKRVDQLCRGRVAPGDPMG